MSNYSFLRWVLILMVSCILATPQAKARSIAFINIGGNDQASVQPFLDLMDSVGLRPTYYPLQDLLDRDDLEKVLPTQHAGAFFVFSGEIFSALDTSPLARRVLDLIARCAKKKHFILGIFLPCFSATKNNPNENRVRMFAPVFNALGLQSPSTPTLLPVTIKKLGMPTRQEQIAAFFYAANRMITRPMTSRPVLYHTTLCLPHQGARFYTDDMMVLRNAAGDWLKFLPTGLLVSTYVAHLLPFFMYWHNPLIDNHLVLGYASLTSFSGIGENFHIRPMNGVILNQIHELLQRGLWQIKELAKGNNDCCLQGKQASLSLPASFQFGKPLVGQDQSVPKKIAWKEIPIFEEKDYPKDMPAEKIKADKRDRQRRQHELIAYLALSGLDTLWISFNPHMFYSPIAKHKDKTKRFERSVALFTKKLVAGCKQLGKPVPKVLVGFEIANNLYAPHLPKNPSVDLYGSVYEDIPAALDGDFWQQEIMMPLKKFVQLWRRPEVNNGVVLAGVVIDLEMYCRKRTGTFFASMGFERPELEKFFGPGGAPANVHEVVSRLMRERLYGRYLTFLEGQAEQLGQRIKGHTQGLIKDAQIVCYAPSVVVDWFYNGFFRGLSGPTSPLGLLTFNVEFNRHRDWFAQRSINAYHRSVMMLSKFDTVGSVQRLQPLLDHDGGFWLNRFSRMAEPYEPTSWVAIEQTPLDQRRKVALCRMIDAMS